MIRTLPDPGTPPTAAELAAYRALAELAARWRFRASAPQWAKAVAQGMPIDGLAAWHASAERAMFRGYR